jgi:formylglycine-generating enzyme required for sulfatase activity
MKTNNTFTVLSLVILVLLLFTGACNHKEKFNQKPTATFVVSPYSGSTSTVFSFDARGTSDDQTPSNGLKIRWDFQNDGVWDSEWDTAKVMTHIYSQEGYYTVGMEVKDSYGATGWTSRNLVVEAGNSLAPHAEFTVSPSSGPVGTLFTFDATGVTDPQENADQLKVRWDFDGSGTWETNFSTTKITTHQFNTEGTYNVTMQVMNTKGLTDQTFKSVVVGSGGNVSLTFVTVEGGSFNMGCTSPNQNECDYDEFPVREVTVNSFQISKYEITNKQYAEFLNQVGASSDGSLSGVQYIFIGNEMCRIKYSGNSFVAESGADDLPVMAVTWQGALAFCEYAGGRLPTEAEWEFAARGGNQSHNYDYSGGNVINDVAWNANNSYALPQKVGTRQANELGIYDMSGNAMEWCSDWYKWNYYSQGENNNPIGPATGDEKVVRGGSVFNGADDCRVSDRYWHEPQNVLNAVGFRVAKDVSK